MTTIGIVPARGGSRRIEGKNLTPVAGLPLVAWTVYAALCARLIDRVIVSTDCPSIAEAARRCSPQVEIHDRPAELATDTATTESVMAHVLAGIGEWDRVVLLQPTSPLRTAAMINEALEQHSTYEADAVVSVTHDPGSYFGWSVQWPTGDRFASPLYDERPRTQDLDGQHRENGAIYIVSRDAWEVSGNRLGPTGADVRAYVMPQWASVDVDTYDDVKVAEFWMTTQLFRRSDEFRRHVFSWCGGGG